MPTARPRSTLMFALVMGAFIGLPLATLSCQSGSGLNKPCNLPHRVDGGVALLTNAEVEEKTASGKDFIAFGSVECEDLVCVRDSTFPKGGEPNKAAFGYCSRPCAQADLCPSDSASLDVPIVTDAGVIATTLNCRALLLDRATLAAIAADPTLGPKIGNVREPYFCARGSSPDGG